MKLRKWTMKETAEAQTIVHGKQRHLELTASYLVEVHITLRMH
jgi:hypothetical protein